MESQIREAAQALAIGDPLSALNRVALRDDASALALRGIAMAQLGEFDRARVLLRGAVRAFGPRQPLARARCIVAEAEIALASRDLGWPVKALNEAQQTLEKHGDQLNAVYARYVGARRLLLIGQPDKAAQEIDADNPASLPPTLATIRALVISGIAIRRLEIRRARSALKQAERTSHAARIPALEAEVANVVESLELPAARLITERCERYVLLDEVEELMSSKAFIVDACRHSVRLDGKVVSLVSRPVLFTLLRVMAEAWPDDVSREELAARAFRAKGVDESYRARLRVEIGRLRRLLKPLAKVNATSQGFILEPFSARKVVVLAMPVEEKHGAVLALLSDGECWSSSAIALALNWGQRSVQRALDALASEEKVCSFGRGRARRWTIPPMPGFTTILLLPAVLPVD
jgi:hypothetical protein